MAPLPARSEPAQGGRRLGGALSRLLGTTLRPPGPLPAQTESRRKKTRAKKIIAPRARLNQSQTREDTRSMNKDQAADLQPGQELVITRVFDAPRELVFKAWTDPEHLKHWW